MSTVKIMVYERKSEMSPRNLRARMRRYGYGQCVLICVVAALISACALTAEYQQPQVDVEQRWRVDYEATADLANTAWWEQFQDPVLDGLITAALNENKDLRVAAARVEEAAAGIKNAQSELWPQIGYGGGISRRQESENLDIPFGDRLDRTKTIYEGFLNASWELDIWGRIRRSTEAARAEYLASEGTRQAVILTLVAAVADSYIELLSLDKKLQIAHETVAYRKELLDLFEKKKRGGQISDLELIQVRSSYEQAATSIPEFEMQIAMQENALSVLLGRNPGPIERGKTLDSLGSPGIPAGIPSDVLVRRPDIRAREQNLIAANAKVGVARTLYFPSISLTALAGYASTDLSDLAKASSGFWELGAGFLGPIFTGGLIKSEIKRAEARYTQLMNEYLNTIQTAFKEVNDALVSKQKFNDLLLEQSKLVRTYEDYMQFSRKSYDAGFSGYITVLDAQQKSFATEIRFTETQRNSYSAIVDIYKSMGGGWVIEAGNQITEPAQKAASETGGKPNS